MRLLNRPIAMPSRLELHHTNVHRFGTSPVCQRTVKRKCILNQHLAQTNVYEWSVWMHKSLGIFAFTNLVHEESEWQSVSESPSTGAYVGFLFACYSTPYISKSQGIVVTRSALGGITATAPRLSNSVRNPSLSKVLPASRAAKSRSVRSGATPTLSCRCPGSRTNRTRLPSASTSATILVVKPPRERPMACVLVPPRAPLPCWCTRTMVPSTMTYSKSASADKASNI